MAQQDLSRLRSSFFNNPSLSDSTMTTHSGFLACPHEVLTMIFQHQSLEKQDIKSLRLTSKELYPAATREFAISYLAEPYVVLTRSSLQTLVKICSHPLFGPHVQSIGFLATTLSTYGLKNRASQLTTKIIDYLKTGSMDHNLALISEYAALCNEQTQLEHSGRGKRLLANALSALNHSFALEFTNDPESIDLTRVLSLSKTMYRSGPRSGRPIYMRCEAEYRTSLFRLVQEAITKVGSGKLLNSLDIGLKHLGYENLGPIIGPYAGMRDLYLDIDNTTLRSRETFVALEQLLGAVPNLELLSFAAGRNSKRPIPSSYLDLTTDIFSIPTTCLLQVLSLQDVACSLESLQKLMERHKQTLNQVRFVRVTLLGSWQDCISWMRKELDLTNFHSEQVCILEQSRMTNKGTFMPRVSKLITTTLKGREDTDTGLKFLAQSSS